MDPSEALLRHSNPFAEPEAAPTFAQWYEEHSYSGTPMGKSLANPYYKEKDARGDALFSEEQEEDYADAELMEILMERKNALEDITETRFRGCRDRMNPFERLDYRPFMNRAALKLANIDAVFALSYKNEQWDKPVDVESVETRYATHAFEADQTFDTTKPEPPTPSLQTPGLFYFADIAGAPGGMSEYLLWRRPMAQGFGISLKGESKALEWETRKLDRNRFRINYGSAGDGDLFKEENIKSFATFVRKQVGTGVNLAVADGGFDFSGNENRQEQTMGRLLICQAATILSLLGGGGSCVIKFFDITTLLTVQLVQYLADLFQTITIFKPISSRPANSERYVVCKGYKGSVEMIDGTIQRLLMANARYAAGKEVTSLFPETNLDPKLVEYVRQSNDELMNAQITSLEQILACLDPTMEGAEDVPPPEAYHLERAWRVWYLPEPVNPPRTSREGGTRGGFAPRGGRGGFASRGGRGGVTGSSEPRDDRCYNCQQPGHISANCTQPRTSGRGGAARGRGGAARGRGGAPGRGGGRSPPVRIISGIQPLMPAARATEPEERPVEAQASIPPPRPAVSASAPPARAPLPPRRVGGTSASSAAVRVSTSDGKVRAPRSLPVGTTTEENSAWERK